MIGTYEQQLSMPEYIIRRVLIAVVTFFLITIMLFLFLRAMPIPPLVSLDELPVQLTLEELSYNQKVWK